MKIIAGFLVGAIVGAYATTVLVSKIIPKEDVTDAVAQRLDDWLYGKRREAREARKITYSDPIRKGRA